MVDGMGLLAHRPRTGSKATSLPYPQRDSFKIKMEKKIIISFLTKRQKKINLTDTDKVHPIKLRGTRNNETKHYYSILLIRQTNPLVYIIIEIFWVKEWT